MKFRTEYIPVPEADFQLNYEKPLLLLGSCFADNIGERLQNSGWKATVNPCGVLYNPLSIADAIERVIRPEYEPELYRHPVSGNAFCFDFSTKFSRMDEAEARKGMADATLSLMEALLLAQTMFVTFGTSWVFELKESGKVVANCHKLPADKFLRRCCSLQEMLKRWNDLLPLIRTMNPELKVIFTVSPVRHLADGFAGNMRSKARLLLLCEELSQHHDTTYFPAYEILTDDLRDYRFYTDDLAHPSAMAADYIFEKFTATYIPPSTLPLMASALKALRRSRHRPIIHP